jgi:hypothetical protein
MASEPKTEGTWAGFHSGAAKFSKDVEREWELVLPLVLEGIDLKDPEYVQRADGMPHRRSMRTMDRAIAIAREVFGGMPGKWAAMYCGISDAIFFEWQAANPAFAELIKRARAARMRSLVKIVRDQAPTTWLAAMTMLERLEFEDFGRTNKVRHSHEGTVNIDVRSMLASPTAIEHMAALEAELSNPMELPAHEETTQ